MIDYYYQVLYEKHFEIKITKRIVYHTRIHVSTKMKFEMQDGRLKVTTMYCQRKCIANYQRIISSTCNLQ